MPSTTQADSANWFTYYAPTVDQMAKYEMLRSKAQELTDLAALCCPQCPHTTAALRTLREAMFAIYLTIAYNPTTD